jgi:outer membrane protein OmpU
MKKLTKIGASALAGSLVATSAYAGSLSVGGTWEVTGEYTTGAGAAAFDALSNQGNPFGSKGNLSFSGSGETDFGTASFFTFTSDAQGAVTSHSVTLDMGDMGLVGFDQGTGAFGLGTIDDKVPSAYEEVWNGTAQTNGDLMDANGGSSGVFGYKNTFFGSTVNIEYAPSVASADAGDGAAGGVAAHADGTSLNFAISNTSMIDGLSFGAGYGETEYDLPSTDVATIDTQSTAVYATYAFGPVTLGAQRNYTSGSVNATNVHIGANEVDIIGVAFNVNENLSVSYESLENTYKKSSSSDTAQADVTTDMDGIQIAYTMGGATLRVSDVSVDNSGGTTGNTEDRTEVSLLMAF